MSEALTSCGKCRYWATDPPSKRAERWYPAAAVRQPGYLPARRPLGFAPPPHDGFALLAAHGCACILTSLPMGDESAMNFEGMSVFFRHFVVFRNVLRVRNEIIGFLCTDRLVRKKRTGTIKTRVGVAAATLQPRTGAMQTSENSCSASFVNRARIRAEASRPRPLWPTCFLASYGPLFSAARHVEPAQPLRA